MIRLFLTTIISSLICFGAVSKNLLASELLNHVTTDHTPKSHSHEHGHKHVAHDHHSDDSDETGQPEEDATQPNHSHSFEMSLLSLSLNVTAPQVILASAQSKPIDSRIESYEAKLDIHDFPNSVFRPPIA